ncbi:MAG: acetate--CoA ligase family protein [Pseudomonadota bacterium]
MNDLQRLLTAKSVAVIGGGVWGPAVFESLKNFGFSGDLFWVHTKASSQDVPVYRSVMDLPKAPDAAFVAVNRHAAVEVMAELSEIGAGGAVCFASGFAEAAAEDADSAGLQKALLEAAGDMPLLGPNCYGFVNAFDSLAVWPDQHGLIPVDRGVAIITQSSNLLISLSMQQRNLPIGMMIAAGNQAQQGMSELGMAALLDPRVTALGLHIEGIDDLEQFQELAATARDLNKPIIALKVGKSTQAQAATVSHTASMAGGDAGADALLKRLGIGRATSLPSFLEALKLAHIHGRLASTRIATVSCSGGEASLSADMALDYGLTFPELNDRQKSGLRAALGPLVALANPLDYHTYIWNDVPAMVDTWTAMVDPSAAITLFIVDIPRKDRCDPSAWDCTIEALTQVAAQTDLPLGMVSTVPELMTEEIATKVMKAGAVPFNGLGEAFEAISILQPAPAPSAPILLPGPDRDSTTLSEAASKAELAASGLRVPQNTCLRKGDTIPNTITYPCVLKAEGLAHKTEAGGVVLGLQNASALENAMDSMEAGSFLIEEMIEGAVVELLVGVTRDPAHGFVLTLGAGGILTEILQDTASVLIPSNRDDIKAAINRLKIASVLAGYRGKPAADQNAILDAVEAVQAYVIANAASIEEVEINPLITTPTNAIAVDALIRKAP